MSTGHHPREWAEASEGASEWGRFFCFSRYAVKQKNRPRVPVSQKSVAPACRLTTVGTIVTGVTVYS